MLDKKSSNKCLKLLTILSIWLVSNLVGNGLGLAGNTIQKCFTEGTQIVVGAEYDDAGVFVQYVTVNIEDIKVGDLVYSYDTATGEVSQKEVTATFVRESDHINYLTIVVENGNEQVIETTDGHPFWVVTNDPDLSRAARDYVFENGTWLYHENVTPTEHGFWIEAKDLRVGDVFLGANGELSVLVDSVRVEYDENITVYNFSVEGNHDYFVLAKEYGFGQTCVLVHNARYEGEVKHLPSDELIAPTKRGNAPISIKDKKPVELHHTNQKPDGPLEAMHPSDHRYGENFKKNHTNTGQLASEIDRPEFVKIKKDVWNQWWDDNL